MKVLLTSLTILLLCLGQTQAQEQAFAKVDSKQFKNLYQLNEQIFRSEQPSKKGFKEIESLGIRTVISFRRKVDDSKRAKGTSLVFEKIPLKSKELQESHIIEALRLIQNAEKPVLIHCFHGSDRTGVISAAYRVVFENWTKEKAIEEMRYEPFGYHEKWYPMLVDIIRDLDSQMIKKELGLD